MGKKAQRGFGYLEVLVSLSLLTLVFVGLNLLNTVALRANLSAYYYHVALQQVDQMIERLQAYGAAANNELLARWNRQNARLLPHGHGQVSGNYPHYRITLYWGQKSPLPCEKLTGPAFCLSQVITV